MINQFDGITILYADDVCGLDVFNKAVDLGFHPLTEHKFHEIPQSKRIKWCEEISVLLLNRKGEGASSVLTNDYYFMRMLEFIVPEDKFQIYHMDNGETVKKFVDLKPNPTLVNGEYLFRISITSALKR